MGLVYSTEGGRMCPHCRHALASCICKAAPKPAPGDGIVRVSRETKGRGGKGVIGHTLTKKTGLLAGAFVGSKDQDMFVISSSGIVIRVAAADIRRVGRASQGVRTMRVEEGATVVALAPVIAAAELE